ncbi:MAG: T-RNA-binding domain protein [candidate division Kazan bacterium GW2011_GWB1_52_7]|uniref:Methionine--tRNA ligase n=1 Tax=candidate division Kazan bacterium GW2011_GWB1_52_7 TaxID=1620414 RepID=A0A0G1X6G4_UNCK3|nr:MAG: T-RNA-binding domain protein [candidate division Kazan bacterium GW2011_GWB1_52_7]
MSVPFSEFQKIDLRVGKVRKVEEIEGLDRIYKLEIDIGEKKPRTILAGVKEHFKPSELLGKSVVVVANLEPKDVRGTLSEGMLLAAEIDGQPILLVPEEKVKPGTPIH